MMAGSRDILAVDHVGKRFYGVQALGDVSLSVKPRTIFGIVGPNGAGKTTLFNVICGAYAPTSGKVLFEGKDITSLSASQTARLVSLRLSRSSMRPEHDRPRQRDRWVRAQGLRKSISPSWRVWDARDPRQVDGTPRLGGPCRTLQHYRR